MKGTSGQDGGIGIYTLPPCTTKRWTTTFKNKQTKSTQNSQKIELYGTPTTKELKGEIFIQTGRKGGDRQPGWRVLTVRLHEARGQGSLTFVYG